MTVGQRIQHYRKLQGLSQEELGQKLLVSRQTVSLWENDQTLPTIDNLVRLKEIFGVSVDALLGEQSDENQTERESSVPTEQFRVQFADKEIKVVKKAEFGSVIRICALIILLIILSVLFLTDTWSDLITAYVMLLIAYLITASTKWKRREAALREQVYVYSVYEHYADLHIYSGSRLMRMYWIPYAQIGKVTVKDEYYVFYAEEQWSLLPIGQDSPMHKALIAKIGKQNSRKIVE